MNLYVDLLYNEFAKYAFDEKASETYRGEWRSRAFAASGEALLDLEIGTGNGYHFAHLAQAHPDRFLVGLELKFKPLIQSIRRCLRNGSENARISRYDAGLLEKIFAEGELNNVYIHHPDPWPRRRDWKHRLIQDEFLVKLFGLQKPGTFVDFKTDSEDYFNWAEERFRRGPYQVTRFTRDLHKSEWAAANFVTQFERIFLRKNQPIFYCRLEKAI